MSRPETLSAPESVEEGGARPELSVVVTLYDEVATLDELHRRLTETLAAFGRAYEILYVDDGSTDGTFAALERIHAATHTSAPCGSSGTPVSTPRCTRASPARAARSS